MDHSVWANPPLKMPPNGNTKLIPPRFKFSFDEIFLHNKLLKLFILGGLLFYRNFFEKKFNYCDVELN